MAWTEGAETETVVVPSGWEQKVYVVYLEHQIHFELTPFIFIRIST